jgi:hypothetical protein
MGPGPSPVDGSYFFSLLFSKAGEVRTTCTLPSQYTYKHWGIILGSAGFGIYVEGIDRRPEGIADLLEQIEKINTVTNIWLPLAGVEVTRPSVWDFKSRTLPFELCPRLFNTVISSGGI